jgi:PPOX class probable F420-dependent enzyme
MINERITKQAYINQRLTDELVIWLSSVRPDGRPHLMPMEFYWTGERMFLWIDKRSQKVANLRHNPYVTLALPDGADVVIVEGTAEVVDNGTAQVWYAPLAKKYGRDVLLDPAAYVVQVTPRKFLTWGGPYEQMAS